MEKAHEALQSRVMERECDFFSKVFKSATYSLVLSVGPQAKNNEVVCTSVGPKELFLNKCLKVPISFLMDFASCNATMAFVSISAGMSRCFWSFSSKSRKASASRNPLGT